MLSNEPVLFEREIYQPMKKLDFCEKSSMVWLLSHKFLPQTQWKNFKKHSIHLVDHDEIDDHDEMVDHDEAEIPIFMRE